MRGRPISEPVVDGALDVTKQAFDGLPVLWARVGVEVSKLGDSVGDVWASCKS
jgi:hypothetical protein